MTSATTLVLVHIERRFDFISRNGAGQRERRKGLGGKIESERWLCQVDF
jgi:hypothetical protein